MRRLIFALAICVACAACARHGEAPAAGEAEDEAAETASDRVEIPAAAARALEIAPAEAAEAPLDVTAPGRVLDAEPLVDAASALQRAAVGADAAAAELSRTRALAEDRANASARDLAAAEVAAADAQGALAAARAHARATFGTSDAARVGALGSALARGERALARLELPPGAPLPDAGAAIAVKAVAQGGAALHARWFGPAGTADAAGQGRALLVTLEAPAPPPGTALEARLALGAPQRGVWLPETAVVWSGSEALAFVAAGDAAFERRALTLLGPARDGYLVRSGVAAGERVVTRGAAQLLSAQTVSGEAEPDED